MTTVGFVGLGSMGGPMCGRLAAAGHRVVAFDLDPAKVQAAVAAGAEPADSATACAEAADLFLTSLPRPDHVWAVMVTGGALAALRPGSLWVDLTTNDLGLVRRLADEAPDGVAVVDSPVTGAVDGARTGRLTLFAGGEQADVDRARTVLDELGTVIACGPLGTGNVVKLVTNQLWFVASAALGEGFAVGLRHEVELGVLHAAIRQSVADSFVAAHDAPSIFAGHYDPSFTLDLCLKDLRLHEALQRDVGADLPLTDATSRSASRTTPTCRSVSTVTGSRRGRSRSRRSGRGVDRTFPGSSISHSGQATGNGPGSHI